MPFDGNPYVWAAIDEPVHGPPPGIDELFEVWKLIRIDDHRETLQR